MPVSTLQVDVSKSADVVIVKLIGEARLDVEDAGLHLDRVAVHHPKVIIVDCSQLTFLSSIGMGLLVSLRRTVVKNGGVVRLAGLSLPVKGALTHACLLPLFEIYSDIDAALAAHG